jgi:hypothetical protein
MIDLSIRSVYFGLSLLPAVGVLSLMIHPMGTPHLALDGFFHSTTITWDEILGRSHAEGGRVSL